MKNRRISRRMILATLALALLMAPSWPAFAAYKVQITFTNFSGRGTMANFPALIKLGTGIGGFNYSQFRSSSGNDLRFWGDSQMTQELNYEIDQFDNTGTSYVWVQVPVFAHNASIWATWGDRNYTNQPAYTTNGATWSQSYRGVWHSQTVGANQYPDSTSGRYHGTNSGSADATGQVAGGKDFTSDYITLPPGAFSAITGQVTISTWQYGRSGSDNFFFEGVAGGTRQLGVNLPWSTYIILYTFAGQHTATTGAGSAKGQWSYWSFVVDGTTVRIYVNGSELYSGAGAGTCSAITSFCLGSLVGGGGYFYDGLVDEFRVSNTGRSANWEWACWMNQGTNHNAFVNYGPVQEQAARGIMFSIK